MGILTLAVAICIAALTSACPSHRPPRHGPKGCTRPHIIYILADDMGWDDVSWNNDKMCTDNLDRIRKKGVDFSNYYTQPACSASRAALLTGYYPFKMHLDSNNMAQYHRWRNHSLSTNITILPEYLRNQGYANHMVGKWQMGFCNWEYTPTRRGFDTYYGSYGGNSDHLTHVPTVGGYDFRDNLNVDWTAKGKYSTTLYTNRAVEIIEDHHNSGDNRPLFLYVAYEAPHLPLQAPEEYKMVCGHIKNNETMLRCAMMAALDEGVGRIEATLEKLGYMENTLLIFSSDNGAPWRGGGCNHPYRGKKRSPYEGAIKVPAFAYGKTLLPNSPYKYSGMMHITDWLPTLLQVAKANPDEELPEDVDGFDQWDRIRRNEESRRKDMVVELGPTENYAAVRIGNWKLIRDKGRKGKCLGWCSNTADLPPERMDCSDNYQLYDLEEDPYEKNNLYKMKKKIAKKLKDFMKEYESKRTRAPIVVNVTASFPENFNGAWSPGWCEKAH